MANPSSLPQFSEIHLNQLIVQIKELPYFDGNPSELSRYIAWVEYLLQLNPTQDVGQTHIIYGAIERTIVDSTQTVIEKDNDKSSPNQSLHESQAIRRYHTTCSGHSISRKH